MARLVVVGLPGAGKTTVARALGERLGCEVADTDDVLAAMVGAPAPDYLRTVGEAQFRVDEVAALRASVARAVVVSTGGGVVVTEAARAILAGEVTVWLDAPDEVLVERVGDGDRPLLADDPPAAIAALRDRRSAWYREVSRARVNTARPLEEVVEDVLRAMMAT